jgi:uncharacterized membrane protein
MSLSRHAFVALTSLVLATAICVGLMAARVWYSGSLNHVFLIWNLFLAWVPFVVAFVAYRLHRSWPRHAIFFVVLAPFWLLFLPNAPYILTDLIHLSQRNNVPLWYDLLMLLWYAWTGFLLGFVSVYLMQQIVADHWGRIAGWAFAISALGLTSFGVYLGRFLRWNSWDIVSNPLAILADIYIRFRHPIAYLPTHAFSFLLAAFLICVYVTVLSFTSIQPEPKPIRS